MAISNFQIFLGALNLYFQAVRANKKANHLKVIRFFGAAGRT